MPDYPSSDVQAPIALPDGLVTISPWSYCSAHANMTLLATPSSQTSTANLAIFVPFRISSPFLIDQVWWWNGTNILRNVDVGVYSEDGRKIISCGATAQAGANSLQVVNVTNTLLAPGLFYLAISVSGSNGNIMGQALSIPFERLIGMAEMANAHPLPATATFATITSFLPLMGICDRSVV